MHTLLLNLLKVNKKALNAKVQGQGHPAQPLVPLIVVHPQLVEHRYANNGKSEYKIGLIKLLQQAPTPSNVLGVFGLSIRTQERDLDEEFSRFGRVEKVTIVYDQRVRTPAPF